MIQVKIIILLLLAATIVLAHALGRHGASLTFRDRYSQVSVPKWNGETIIVNIEKIGGEGAGETTDIPPYLTPLFFQPLPINEADFQLLLTVPGIGPSTAAEILKTRMTEGSFNSADDLLKVKGIGPKKKELLRRFVTF